ncbi:MAG: ABC transporter permease [Solirubrobacteraceae bacterium]
MWKVTLSGLLARKLRLALTALAIVLGVMFVTGTLVLTDTLNRTFDTLVGTAYQHINFQIRGKAAFDSDTAAAVNGTDRKPVPESIATAVGRLPGVAYVDGSVEGYAQFVARDGNAIGGAGSALGFSFDPDRQLSAVRLVEGSAPTTAREVLMDRGTAAKYDFRVGARVQVLSGQPPQTFTISGIVTFGSADNLAGTTLAGFDRQTAQDLFNMRGYYDTINVLAKPGADNVRLQRSIARLLPADMEVVSGQTVANELSSAVSDALSFLSTALLVFALISLFVGAFTIFNTFSITVGQRTRELALLRIVGASRRQLFRSVLGEAAAVGLAASMVGLVLGVLAAVALRALLGAFGITLPSAPLVFEARTAVIAIAVGVGVTVVSAIAPARRAVRIAPVAALVDHQEDEGESLRRRVIAGSVVAIAGVAVLVAGLTAPAIGLVGLGALAMFVGAAVLAPIVARPMSGALGRPLAALLGTPGRLGRENSMRSPRRTAQTAAALMVGMALVSAIAVLGASLSASATSNVDSAVSADYIITGPNSGFSTSVAPAVSRIPGVATVTTVYKGQFELRGSLESLTAVDPAELPRTVHLALAAGSGASALAAGELLIDTTTASAKHLTVGSVVPVTFAQTGAAALRIGGIFKANPLIGSYVVAAGFFRSHFHSPLPIAVLVSAHPGAQHVGRAINIYLNAYPNVGVQSRAQFEQAQQHTVNTELGLVYVLLALAIAVALIGIVNTLMLSVFERTRELGLLRAVGMKRRQVREMIRSEAVIIALFGAVIGVIIGTALGVAFAASLGQQGITEISIPVGTLVGFLVLSVLLGLGAASWPARRAANLDVLAAIAAE